jgi:hypothetical protein
MSLSDCLLRLSPSPSIALSVSAPSLLPPQPCRPPPLSPRSLNSPPTPRGCHWALRPWRQHQPPPPPFFCRPIGEDCFYGSLLGTLCTSYTVYNRAPILVYPKENLSVLHLLQRWLRSRWQSLTLAEYCIGVQDQYGRRTTTGICKKENWRIFDG